MKSNQIEAAFRKMDPCGLATQKCDTDVKTICAFCFLVGQSSPFLIACVGCILAHTCASSLIPFLRDK